jgi:hypothetical protein
MAFGVQDLCKMLPNHKFTYDSSQEKRTKVQRFRVQGQRFEIVNKYHDPDALSQWATRL